MPSVAVCAYISHACVNEKHLLQLVIAVKQCVIVAQQCVGVVQQYVRVVLQSVNAVQQELIAVLFCYVSELQ